MTLVIKSLQCVLTITFAQLSATLGRSRPEPGSEDIDQPTEAVWSVSGPLAMTLASHLYVYGLSPLSN